MEQDMSDDVFYDSLAEVMDLPPQDLYAQLAEEGAELTQAALKCIRAQGFSENPTPVSSEDAVKNLQDELNDVLIVAYVLGLVGGYSVRNWDKLERWAKRIREAREEHKNHGVQGL